MNVDCPYCHNATRFSIERRNSREFAQTRVICDECGAEKIDTSAHNPYRPEQRPFDAARNRIGRVVGEWSC